MRSGSAEKKRPYTTVTVSPRTKDRLTAYREEWYLKSHDEAINKVLDIAIEEEQGVRL